MCYSLRHTVFVEPRSRAVTVMSHHPPTESARGDSDDERASEAEAELSSGLPVVSTEHSGCTTSSTSTTRTRPGDDGIPGRDS